MIRVLIFLLVLSISGISAGSDLCNSIFKAVREYQGAGHFYLVEYEYDAERVMYRDNGEDHPHYPARVAVFEIIQGKKVQVGYPFHSYYVPGGCVEDRPADMVRQALNGQ